MEHLLEFEKSIGELEKKLKDFRDLSVTQSVDLSQEMRALEKKWKNLLEDTYANLSPWQLVQVSRHPNRPYTKDYIDAIFTDFQELHGDRAFGDDAAIVGGTALFNGEPVLVIGQQKGRTTKQKMERNFGMARPEGYRKCIRLLELASRFHLPVIAFIDTPGAFPGLDAEERGQAQAIAECIRTLFTVQAPMIGFVIGEGGSGGALALGATDRLYMLQYSTYSVISPESCASILWNDSTLAERAAERIRLTAKDLFEFKLIDAIVPEPMGGAHRDWDAAFDSIRGVIARDLKKFDGVTKNEKTLHALMEDRFERYRKIGTQFVTEDTLEAEPKPKAGLSTKTKTKKTKKKGVSKK